MTKTELIHILCMEHEELMAELNLMHVKTLRRKLIEKERLEDKMRGIFE